MRRLLGSTVVVSFLTINSASTTSPLDQAYTALAIDHDPPASAGRKLRSDGALKYRASVLHMTADVSRALLRRRDTMSESSLLRVLKPACPCGAVSMDAQRASAASPNIVRSFAPFDHDDMVSLASLDLAVFWIRGCTGFKVVRHFLKLCQKASARLPA